MEVVGGLKREIREEAGIECEEIKLRGTISWPGFGKNGEDWLGFIFLIERYSGAPHSDNPEGVLEWIDRDNVLALPLWEGDHYFLPLVFGDDPRTFHALMPYHDGRPTGWRYEWI